MKTTRSSSGGSLVRVLGVGDEGCEVGVTEIRKDLMSSFSSIDMNNYLFAATIGAIFTAPALYKAAAWKMKSTARAICEECEFPLTGPTKSFCNECGPESDKAAQAKWAILRIVVLTWGFPLAAWLVWRMFHWSDQGFQLLTEDLALSFYIGIGLLGSSIVWPWAVIVIVRPRRFRRTIWFGGQLWLAVSLNTHVALSLLSSVLSAAT